MFGSTSKEVQGIYFGSAWTELQYLFVFEGDFIFGECGFGSLKYLIKMINSAKIVFACDCFLSKDAKRCL